MFSEAEYRQSASIDLFVEDNASSFETRSATWDAFRFSTGEIGPGAQGRVFDVSSMCAADRRRSESGRVFASLRCGCEQLYVPRGFAHGFYVLSDEAIISYKQTDFYDPASEAGALERRRVGIAWPLRMHRSYRRKMPRRRRSRPFPLRLEEYSLPGRHGEDAQPLRRRERIHSELLIDALRPAVVIEQNPSAGHEAIPEIFDGGAFGRRRIEIEVEICDAFGRDFAQRIRNQDPERFGRSENRQTCG